MTYLPALTKAELETVLGEGYRWPCPNLEPLAFMAYGRWARTQLMSVYGWERYDFCTTSGLVADDTLREAEQLYFKWVIKRRQQGLPVEDADLFAAAQQEARSA
ncbi:hypothetical protein [Aliiruegeria lutimaris]|uniref:Uncharacterized protein n=1 Tax=Aliiruegeria lutimaris TaxID=571298 RepID=A0A1G9ERY4_9RHOB|nr:hypothetical protein [Aliiruegeria lutimaris]SDK78838.1 hypothetical protein SAMN04488026_10549 [Aliiruegeria lutimaris]